VAAPIIADHRRSLPPERVAVGGIDPGHGCQRRPSVFHPIKSHFTS
jgi:hypothetical protein